MTNEQEESNIINDEQEKFNVICQTTIDYFSSNYNENNDDDDSNDEDYDTDSYDRVEYISDHMNNF